MPRLRGRVVAKPNGYALFAKHIQSQYPGMGQDQAFAYAEPIWQTMTEKVKQSWKEQAKAQKTENRIPEVPDDAPSSLLRPAKKSKPKPKSGIVRDEISRISLMYYNFDSRSERELFAKKRETDRKDLISYFEWAAPSRAEVTFQERLQYFRAERDFHLMTMTSWWEEPGRATIPAEISLVSFNLGTGIIGEKHWLLALPENLPSHLQRAIRGSQSKAAQSGIPPFLEDLPEEIGALFTTQHGGVMGKISEKARRGKFLFVHREEYNVAQGGVDWLKQKQLEESGHMSKSFSVDKIKCIEDLVTAMMSLCACEGGRLSRDMVDVVDNYVEYGIYDAATHVACDFHRRVGKPNACSLTRAKKILYSVFEQLKDPCFLELTDQHILDGITKVDQRKSNCKTTGVFSCGDVNFTPPGASVKMANIPPASVLADSSLNSAYSILSTLTAVSGKEKSSRPVKSRGSTIPSVPKGAAETSVIRKLYPENWEEGQKNMHQWVETRTPQAFLRGEMEPVLASTPIQRAQRPEQWEKPRKGKGFNEGQLSPPGVTGAKWNGGVKNNLLTMQRTSSSSNVETEMNAVTLGRRAPPGLIPSLIGGKKVLARSEEVVKQEEREVMREEDMGALNFISAGAARTVAPVKKKSTPLGNFLLWRKAEQSAREAELRGETPGEIKDIKRERNKLMLVDVLFQDQDD